MEQPLQENQLNVKELSVTELEELLKINDTQEVKNELDYRYSILNSGSNFNYKK